MPKKSPQKWGKMKKPAYDLEERLLGGVFFIRCWTFDVRCSSFRTPWTAQMKLLNVYQTT